MQKVKFSHKVIAVLLTLTFLNTLAPYNMLYANNNGPNAPEAAAFEPVDATDMVNLVSGDLAYVLPLLNVPSPEGGYPLSLSYHAGIAMDQEASWVGLGWNLNPGAINRGVNGYPDDWGKTEINEFFYDQGYESESYSFGAGLTLSGAVSVGLGASWGSDKSRGGYVSASIGPGDGKSGAAIGVTAGIENDKFTGSVSASLANFSVSIGTNGVGIGYGFSAGDSANMGVGLNYNYNSGLSGGISLSTKNKEFDSFGSFGGGARMSAGIGINFSSNGVSANPTVNGRGAGAFSKAGSLGQGDYFSIISSTGFFLPFVIFYISFSHTKIKHQLGKYNSLYTSGMMYPIDANEQINFDGFENLKTTHFMDVAIVQKFRNNDIYNDLIDNENKSNTPNLVIPSYDNYTVNAQGLSGSITPYHPSEINLSGRGKGQNDHILFGELAYINYETEEYYSNDHPLVSLNQNVLKKRNFTFLSSYSSFLRSQSSKISGAIDPKFFNGIQEGYRSDPYATNRIVNRALFHSYGTEKDNSFSSQNSLNSKGIKREGNYIQTYTNEEIRESILPHFIEATTAGSLLDRADEDTFLDHGIGGFSITSYDGKTYHYSLPVYQFENSYRNFKELDDEGKEKDKNFFEVKKDKPFATHWLLTAITGPDYIDTNGDKQVNKEDYGYWVSLDYGKWTDGYVWQTPNGRYEEIPDKQDKNDVTYSYAWGRKQLYYLDAIKTRTHTALFVKEEREDNKSIAKKIHNEKNTWELGEPFNIADHGKSYKTYPRASAEIKRKSGDSYYSKNGVEYTFEQTFQNCYKHYYDAYIKKRYDYYDFSENRSLALKKILLIKNDLLENININKIGNKTKEVKGYYSIAHQFNRGIEKCENYRGSTRDSKELESFEELYLKDPRILKEVGVELWKNVLDTEDISSLDLERKAIQVIDFDYNYELAQNAQNTDSGRLTLKAVNFKGKQGKQFVPPYKFDYLNSEIAYNKEDIDDWGYHKTIPEIWSLNNITTPTGGNIKITHEPDHYDREAVTSF